MRPKLVTTERGAQYVPQHWAGDNTSGWRPIGDTVLVLPDIGAETAGTSGSIYLPGDIQERNSLASESGVIVAIGDGAFVRNSARTGTFVGTAPEPGDRIIFARYSGRVVQGADGSTYRMMSDDCIAGVQIRDDDVEVTDFGLQKLEDDQ